jgi:hypothetical protein
VLFVGTRCFRWQRDLCGGDLVNFEHVPGQPSKMTVMVGFGHGRSYECVCAYVVGTSVVLYNKKKINTVCLENKFA